MKIAFVMGFFDSVKTRLNECYHEDVYRDRLIWIPRGGNAVTAFKGRFYDVVRTAEGIMVCLGSFKREAYLEAAVRGIVRTAEEKYACSFLIEPFGNLYDPEPVVQKVKSFGIETQPQITSAKVRSKVRDGKILCMSLHGKTSILAALERAGFSTATIGECFHEEIRGGARNSNLMEELKSEAARHTCLLYAWEGLRTLKPDVKGSFKYGCHEARTASQVVELFKTWINGD